MSEQLDIVVTSIDAGAAEAAKRLAQAFDLSAVEAEQFVRELPRVAKRNASREEAERYVEALRAIGARVETLASPEPRPTMRARMMSSPDQLVIPAEPEAEQPGMRFRAGGHLGMISVPPNDVLHPSFPKAPLIPRDMHKMPNGGELPMPSIRPMYEDDENGAFDDFGNRRRHTDAQPPPPLVLTAREIATQTTRSEPAISKPASAKPASAKPASAKPARGGEPSAKPSPASEPGMFEAQSAQSNAPLVIGIVLALAVAALLLARFVL
jgi:cell division septation protein DedD